MGKPTKELRAKLDEFGVRWWPDVYYRDTNTCWRVGDFEWRASEKKDGKLLIGCTCVKYLTPEQAIAATVGNRTDLSKRLREVTGLHAFAELFGFDWTDDSDWTWHDVACAMADAVDAATAGKDIERYDGSGRRGTVAILQGGRKPEEVMFVHDEGGVTHYLPEVTCHLEECEHEREIPHDLQDCDGGWYTEVTYDCDECGYENTDPNIRFCGGCGRKVVAE